MEAPPGHPSLPIEVRQLLVIAIDLVNDFTNVERGIFHVRYGVDGRPVADVFMQIQKLGSSLAAQGAEVYQVGSRYTYKQFRTKGLERLCVDEWGRQPALDTSLYPLLLLKTGNGLFSSPDTAALEKLRAALRNASHVLVVGCTTCSCIRATVEQLLAEAAAAHICVLVAEDAVAGRTSQLPRQNQLFTQWRSAHPLTRLRVISSWQQIRILPKPPKDSLA